jgi:hypothetical protein
MADDNAYTRGYATCLRRFAKLARGVRLAEDRLSKILVGGCTCDTKSVELQEHAERCHFRLASEALEALQPANAHAGAAP